MPNTTSPHSGKIPGRTEAGILTGLDQNIGASPRIRSMEDVCFAGTVRTAGGLILTLGLVADGIGGECSGERAAALTVETAVDSILRSTEKSVARMLQAALQDANRLVREEARREIHKRDMGSTATLAAIHQDRLYLASVGDSRAFLVRGENVTQLTRDHSWENEMVRSGKLSPEEAARHPHARALVRSVGSGEQIDVDLGLYWDPGQDETEARKDQGVALLPGDDVLLCSDGLTKMRPDGRGHFVERAEFPDILRATPPLQAARTLVSRALGRNANDNVSVVILRKPAPKRSVVVKLLRWGIAALALAGLILFGTALLPGIISSVHPPVPAPSAGSALVAEAAGEALYLESDGSIRSLVSDESLPVREGGVLQTLDGTLELILPDSARLHLDRFSIITLAKIAGVGMGERETAITLERGRMLVAAVPYPGFSISILVDDGLRAQPLDALMGVTFDIPRQQLELDCLAGTCLLANIAGVKTLAGGQSAWMDPDRFGGITSARYAVWADLGAGDPLWPTSAPIPFR